MHLHFTPFPVLSTSRLHLRQLTSADVDEIFFFRTDERMLKFINRPKAESLEDARSFIEKISGGIARNEWIYWGITLQGSDKLIGTICLWNIYPAEEKAEIGYELHPDFQGQGLMQEAIVKVMKYAFDTMQVREIEALLRSDNLRSVRVLERSGFHYVRLLTEEEKYEDEKEIEVVVYAKKGS
ncbi:MAG: GNAT family N-acetyltransferase [Lewinellaceae bacterium]|nr:GNAT family N-acetyltransferase [Lewinellaceae bacterium]